MLRNLVVGAPRVGPVRPGHPARMVDVATVEHSRDVRSVVVPEPRRPRPDPAVTAPGRTHRIAVVDTDDELIAVSLGYLRAGLAAGDLTVAVLPPAAAEHVRGQLPGVEVHAFRDTRLREPECIAVQLELLRRARSEGRHLRLLGQVQEQRRRAWDERIRGELAHEHVLAGEPVHSLCLYDRRVTPPDVLATALLAHPEVVESGRVRRSPGHRTPAELIASLPMPREPLQETEPVFSSVDTPSLPELRHQLAAVLRGRFGDRDAEEDFHLAASEIAANAFRHGARPVCARVWAGVDRVVCTISDGGTDFDGALSGYLPAHGDDLSRGGMGMWMARKLCDHVDVECTPGGVSIRLATAVRT